MITSNLAQKIEVEIPSCPVVKPMVGNVPSWVVGWGYFVGTIVVLALIIAIACGVVSWFEYRKKKMNSRFNQELALADREISMAKLHKSCDICGTEYKPEVLPSA